MAKYGNWFIPFGPKIQMLILKCQKEVSKLLFKSNFSDSSIKKAVDIVKEYSDKIENKINYFKKEFLQIDDQKIAVKVESTAEATGTSAEINNAVDIGIFEAGDNASLCIASAKSFAAADGADAKTKVTAFTGVTGVDSMSVHTYYGKGANFETAAQFLVAVDFTNVVDKNWTFKSRDKWYTKAKTKVADGPGTAVMTASVDEYVEASDSVSMKSAIDQLAYDSTIKATVTGEVVLS